jgi:SAM-dependent methyltransferase
MAHETSKAMGRRLRDPVFRERYFVGDALDIGAGSDGLGRQIGVWPLLKTVSEWDVGDGDAQYLEGVPDNSFDLVYSSHCLEHVRNPDAALHRWHDVLKPGGHMVVAVPDYVMYEREQWPSRFNDDHKTRFTFQLVAEMLHYYAPIKVERIIEHFDPSLPKDQDQTQGLAECCIELIVRKPE